MLFEVSSLIFLKAVLQKGIMSSNFELSFHVKASSPNWAIFPRTYLPSVVFKGQTILNKFWEENAESFQENKHCWRHIEYDFEIVTVVRRHIHSKGSWAWPLANNSTAINNLSLHLLNTYVPSTILHALCVLSHWTFTTTLWNVCSWWRVEWNSLEWGLKSYTERRSKGSWLCTGKKIKHMPELETK